MCESKVNEWQNVKGKPSTEQLQESSNKISKSSIIKLVQGYNKFQPVLCVTQMVDNPRLSCYL